MRLKLLFLCLCVLPSTLWAELHYTLTPDVPGQAVVVTLQMDAATDTTTFHIPAWVPGYYMILQNQDKLSDFDASDPKDNDLPIDHPDGRTWVVHNPKHTPITISYRVFGDDPGLGFFAVHMDMQTGYVNGPAAFVYPDGRMTERVTLKVNLPEGWDIATSMEHSLAGNYFANGYDEFVDHPIQMGHFIRQKFTVASIPFEAIFVGQNGIVNCNTPVETERLRMLSVPAITLFGGSSFRRYDYIIHLAVGNFSGGLEHRASNVQAVSNSTALNLDELATHEYFHAWNVKQIRPKVLGPFDYTQEVKTDNLWFAEGVTDYYAYITAYRSGVHDQNWLLFRLGQQIARLQRSGNRMSVPLDECSRRAWESGGSGVGDLSYYNKGLVAGLLIDAAIRSKTSGLKSLDDVMRVMYSRYRLPNAGYEEDGVLKAINEVCGQDLTEMYNGIVYTTDEMPYDVLSGIGLKYEPMGDLSLSVDSAAGASATARCKEWLKRPDGVGQ